MEKGLEQGRLHRLMCSGSTLNKLHAAADESNVNSLDRPSQSATSDGARPHRGARRERDRFGRTE